MRASPQFAVTSATGWRTQVLIVVGLQLSQLLIESVRVDQTVLYPTALDYFAFKADELLRLAVSALALVGALKLVERLPLSGLRRKVAAVALMLAGAVLGTVLASFDWPYEPVSVRLGASASMAVWFWYRLWMNTLVALLAYVIIDRMRTRHEAIERLAD